VTAIAEETALEQYERRLIEVVDEMEKGARLGPLDDYALLRSARDALQVRRERIESLSAENAELRVMIDDLTTQLSKAEGTLAGSEAEIRSVGAEPGKLRQVVGDLQASEAQLIARGRDARIAALEAELRATVEVSNGFAMKARHAERNLTHAEASVARQRLAARTLATELDAYADAWEQPPSIKPADAHHMGVRAGSANTYRSVARRVRRLADG
jgi:chromosome segregation ATPase